MMYEVNLPARQIPGVRLRSRHKVTQLRPSPQRLKNPDIVESSHSAFFHASQALHDIKGKVYVS